MAYSTLRAAIQAAIKQNDNEEITGNLLQSVLLSIVNTVGAGYNFAGVATPSTNPGTPDGAMFWIGGKGTYANFGSSVTIAAGYLGIFMWDGSAFTRSVIKLSGGEGVFDVTDYTGNEYANLSAALAAIPQEAKAGGMQIRFVQSSDHNYVQYMYTGTAITGSPNPFTNIANWQKINIENEFSQVEQEVFGVAFSSVSSKYIKPDGTIGNSNVGFYTYPIEVKAGEILTYSIKGNNCAILSTYNEGVYTPVVIAPASDTTYTNQTYTAESDGYVVFSGTPNTLILKSSISRIDESFIEINNLKANIEDTEFVYALYGDSTIIANTIYIDQLLQYGVKGADGTVYNINSTFVMDSLAVLVFNRITGQVQKKKQRNVISTDDILLIADNTNIGFFKCGKLLGDCLVNKTRKIPYSIAQRNKAITDQGTVVSASFYIISAPFFLPAGMNVVIRTAGYLVSALSKYNPESNTYTPIIAYHNDGVVTLRNAYTTIQQDGYYVISTLDGGAYLSKPSVFVLNDILCDYNVKLVPGNFSLNNGSFWYTADGSLLSAFVSEKLLKVPDGARIVQIEGIESGEDYYIAQFDDNFNFITYVKNGLGINNRCRYIRLSIARSTAYIYSKRNIKIFVLANKPCEFVFNTLPSLASSRWIWHTYEVKNTQPVESTDTPTTSFVGDSSRIYSKCYIVLPENYTPTGKPCKVIINCHGTSQISLSSTALAYNTAYVDFLVKCGYAVIGCYSQASLSWQYNSELNIPSSLCMSAYQGMWDYLTSLYNIDKTGAYVFGYSAGGAETVMLSQLKTIPIRCAASLAGTLDSICNMRILTGAGCNNDAFERFGLTYTTLPGGLSSQGAMYPIDSDIKDYLMQHLNNIKPYNAFSLHSTLDYSAFQNRFMDIRARTQELEADTTLNELISQAKVELNTPLKIWQAVDDVNVPIQLSRWYAKMVMNAGGICFLREFPSGCGAHNAVGNTDDASLTPMVDYVTPYGETVNVPVTYAEMVEWFRKW